MPTRSMSTLLCCVLAGLLIVPALAPTRADAEEFELKVTESIPVEQFLKTISAVTKVPLVWNPSDKTIKGKQIMGGIDLRGDKTKFFDLVRALLTFYDLVLVPVGPADQQVQLVMEARPAGQILRLKPQYVRLTEENLAAFEHQDGLFITTTIKVENMPDLRNARNALSRLVTQQNIGNVTEVPAAGAFVVTDFAPNVVSIYRLIKEMDVGGSAAGTGGTMESVEIRYAHAEALAATLRNHFTGDMPQRTGPRTPASARVVNENNPHPGPQVNRIVASELLSVIERMEDQVGS